MLSTIFNSQYLKILYSNEWDIGALVWDGFVPSTEYRIGLEATLKAASELQITKWLGDNRNMKTIRVKDQEWTNADWLPRFCSTPVQKMAILISQDFFNQLAVENMMSKDCEYINFDHRYFTSEHEALSWLREEV